MSYEILVFQPALGNDVLEQGRQRMRSPGGLAAKPSPQADQFKAGMQNIILSLQPEYEVLETDFDMIAEEEGISVAKARAQYRDVEITPAGDGLGPHLTLQDDQVIFTLPDTPKAEDARTAFDVSWALLVECARMQGVRVYDAQLDTLLRPMDSLDAQAARQKYESLVVEVAKPWWKLW